MTATMTDKELIQEIRKVRLADLSDGMDALGLVNVGSMNTNMRPLRPGISFAGFAWTLKLLPAQKSFQACSSVEEYMQNNGKWCSDTYSYQKLLKSEDVTDKVLVIDMGGVAGGILGSENTMLYKRLGMAGAVVDGGCRDSYECNLQEANVFSTVRTFHHITGRVSMGGTNIPVECAGVTVHPGDIICADDDGVLVIPRDRAEEVLKIAIEILEQDQKIRAQHYEALGMQADQTLNRRGN